ncbi:putative U3 small nucleolar RNA-associated protein 7 Short=U3 snoRNA-associated protein 7 [Rhizoctonia solani AG-1 IB]|uniref:Putative U3 small nucleolar RNA-associated protein 7 Short=U3 snoRNA-associated protein 7 n=1 Tax=Thanatephorus cucumeris (strain AG1-IB / isolate 7/3/14) TaxID=1108050 RepID=M5BMQ1_THACB|nr:putative U3 small nucleolar RNA-associated protein 7 Short=U3 snoRNA-associated protein 7 [Rhizoctonia solani AG-1 IB]
MDALTAAADAIKTLNDVKKGPKKQRHHDRNPQKKRPDATLHSITPRADLPRSMRPAATESKTHGPYAHIRDKKLKAKLHSQVAQASQAKALRQDATTWLAGEPGGKMQVETELERTWRTTQTEIVEAVGSDIATGRREWKWDLGPYRAHLGPITSLSVDPSTGGRYLATAGQDSRVKIWDCRNWKGKGWLGVIGGGSINVYAPPAVYAPAPSPNSTIPPSLYLTHPIPHRPLVSMRFCPFQDTIAIGHARGVSSIVVPGSGEANIDSFEDGVFENKKGRQEREVRNLLDKLQPDMITLDPEFIGQLAEPGHVPFATPELPFRQKPRLDRLRDLGKADESPASDGEEVDNASISDGDKQSGRPKTEEKMKMRGKGKSLKRHLRKKRKNVIDPSTVAIREKIAKMQATRKAEARQKAGLPEKEPRLTALDRFKRSTH